ncbi:hypothetical protein EHO57_14080 [Leptospira langatensis]|uniref:Uncharacterized protein n=1 Tax=Leptospira langatensis TaxID=2484983 RepID=A0A5R2AT40_9LEPT|nr:hypothetical protein EHO57_14080 [Leptospira langatensis]
MKLLLEQEETLPISLDAVDPDSAFIERFGFIQNGDSFHSERLGGLTLWVDDRIHFLLKGVYLREATTDWEVASRFCSLLELEMLLEANLKPVPEVSDEFDSENS